MDVADTGCAWAVKESFLAYIKGLRDGQVSLGGGAAATSTGEFYFPFTGVERYDDAATALCFGGTVRFTGHYGFMSVVLENPRIHLSDGAGTLVNGADEQGLAELDLPEPLDGGGVRMWTPVPARLAAPGVELFGDTYAVGELLAPLTIRVPAEAMS